MSFLLSQHMTNLQEMVPATKTWNHRWVVCIQWQQNTTW
jgi:hypothetical protein